MRNVAKRRRRALASAVGLALAGAAAPAAAAADDCPNAAIRAQQGAAQLPECRAYELVSPPQKNGNAAISTTFARPDGGMLAYTATGAFAGSQSSVFAHYRAERTASGWTTTALNPPTLGRNASLFDEPQVLAISSDFARVALATQYPVDPRDEGPLPGDSKSSDLYVREPDGSFSWPSRGERLPDRSTEMAAFAGASDALDTFVFETRRALTAEVPDESTTQLYVRSGESLRLASVAPDGRPFPQGARIGAQGAGINKDFGGRAPEAVSADGRAIAFTAGGFDPSGQPQVYLRSDPLDPARATTRLVSRTASGAGCAVAATFMTMSADGGTVVFSCRGQLTADAPADGGVYAYDVAGGDVTFLTPDRGGDVTPITGLRFVAADRRLASIYLVSRGRLTDDAERSGSLSKLYVLRDGAIAHVASVASTIWTLNTKAVSEDGGQLAFETNRPIASPQTFPTGATTQVYAYDARADALACASCRPDGRPSEGRSGLNVAGLSSLEFQNRGGAYGNVTDDGRVFFTTSEALVPQDANRVHDAYVSIAGRPHLLSSGTDPAPSIFSGASADGRDAYVLTHESLVPQDVDAGVTDLYAVRVGGGFPAPAPPAPGCESGCQGPLQAPPALPQPGTVAFTGPDDEDERLAPATAATFAVAAVGARQRALWARRGRTTLHVRVSHAGRVRVLVHARIGRRSVRVASATRRAAEGGTLRVPLRLSGRARAQLRRSGALRLRVRVSYSQRRGAQSASLVLRTEKRGARR